MRIVYSGERHRLEQNAFWQRHCNLVVVVIVVVVAVVVVVVAVVAFLVILVAALDQVTPIDERSLFSVAFQAKRTGRRPAMLLVVWLSFSCGPN